MEENSSPFRYDYDLKRLQRITPKGRHLQMLVTPRFIEHYHEKPYESFSSDLLLNLCGEGTLFIDVGAHYGYYTLLVGTAYPGCRIIALEPVPENYAVLQRNVALNGLKNVELHNLAASDSEGFRDLKVKEASDSCSFYDHPLTHTLKEIEVQTVSLDGFLQLSPDMHVIIKVDTDGHEPHVLRGMKNLLRESSGVSLLVEFNPKCLRKAGHQPEQFLEEIFALGLEIHAIDEANRLTYKLSEPNLERWAEYLPGGDESAYVNLLCLKKEKSLSVCFFSHSSQLAGAERSLLELVDELVKDYKVLCTVVLREDGPLREKMAQTGASVIEAGYTWWWQPEDMPPEQRESLHMESLGEVAYHIEHVLCKINPDVIATFTTTIPWGAMAAFFLGKPHAWFIREMYDRDQPVKGLLPLDESIEFIDRFSSLIVVNSDYVRKELFSDAESHRVVTVYTHVDIPPDALEGQEETCFSREGATKLMLAGAVYDRKGQRDAVLAVRELVREGRDVELVIMGFCADMKYADRLQNTIMENRLEKHVKHLGFQENPYPFMKQADILLSCSRHEAFGRTTVEGMLLKKPVIATREGGTVELVQNGFNGLLYTPGDYRHLAELIAYLADNPEEARRLGENGFRSASRAFTKEEYGGKIYALLKKLKGEAADRFPQTAITRDGRTFFETMQQVAATGNPLINLLITRLANSMAEKNRRAAELAESLRAREERLAELSAQVAQLQYDLGVRVEQIVERDIHIAALENMVRQIEGRMAIRLADRCQRVMERLMPSGTRRRRGYDLAMKGLRSMLKEGWRGFWKS